MDAPDQISLIETTVVNPPVGTGNYEQAGLWFGNDQDNYLKLEILSEPGPTTRIEYLFESGGVAHGLVRDRAAFAATSNVTLRMRANPTDRTVAAYFSINGADLTQLGTFIVPGEFFSFDAAGIDPAIGTRSFGGIFASHRYGQRRLTYAFDDFSVTAETPPALGIGPQLQPRQLPHRRTQLRWCGGRTTASMSRRCSARSTRSRSTAPSR